MKSKFLYIVAILSAALVAAEPTVYMPQGGKPTPVIASWDVVPHQRINKIFQAGVVAFHETGCRVEFDVTREGKSLMTAKMDNPKLNKRVSVWEFFVTLDPAKLGSGKVEIKAKAIPLGAGMIATELPTLVLYLGSTDSPVDGTTVWADAERGSDTAAGTKAAPVKTLAAASKLTKDGGTIHLQPGTYVPNGLKGGRSRKHWTTIRSAPGVKREQVKIIKGRPGVQRLRFRDVSIVSLNTTRKYYPILSGENGRTMIWLDNCHVYQAGERYVGNARATGNRYQCYITGGLSEKLNDGPSAVIMRNHKLKTLTSDVFTGAKLAVNCEAIDVDPGKTGAHPDFHQSYNPKAMNSGIILYNVRGLKCKSQGFFGSNLKDSAFVNCLFEKQKSHFTSQYSGKVEHVLFFHITLPNQSFRWRQTIAPANIYMVNNIIANLGEFRVATPITYAPGGIATDHNHLITKSKVTGKNSTEGKGIFVDATQSDYTLKPNTPPYRSGVRLQCVPADINGKPYGDKPNRGCFAD